MDTENTEEFDLDDSDSDEIPLTAAQVIEMMREAWLNEKFAPEILPHKSEVVECLLGQITYMEENLEQLNNADFQKNLHQMEVDRLRYLLTSYLRTRLEKIEKYVYVILKSEEERIETNESTYLTDNELQFAKTYRESLDQHFDDTLKFWPGLPPDDWKKDVVKPNIHSFVFAKSKERIEGIMIDDGGDEEGDLVDVNSGRQMIISYNSISGLIKNDKAFLI